MRTVFHLLTEVEPFSEYRGGAISRWAANVLSLDSQGIVAAISCDASWAFPVERVLLLPRLCLVGSPPINAAKHLSHKAYCALVGFCLKPLLSRWKSGDLIWVHNRPELASALWDLANRAGVKIMLHMHNSHLTFASAWALKRIPPANILFVSNYLRQQMVQRSPLFASSHVLYNGASETVFFPSERREKTSVRSSFTVLFASRVVPEKGPHILSEALRILECELGNEICGVIVGASNFGGSKDTPYMERLKREAPPNLVFRDYCAGSALAALFREADVFCLPAVWDEPLGMAVLEAMATGLPIVMTMSGGMPEALAEGGGIIIEKNSPVALAAALKELYVNETLRRTLGAEAYKSFLQNFRWKKIQQDYARLVETTS